MIAVYLKVVIIKKNVENKNESTSTIFEISRAYR